MQYCTVPQHSVPQAHKAAKELEQLRPLEKYGPGPHFTLQLFRFHTSRLCLHLPYMTFISHHKPEMGRNASFQRTVTDNSVRSTNNLSFVLKVAVQLQERPELSTPTDLGKETCRQKGNSTYILHPCSMEWESKERSHLEHHSHLRWIQKQYMEQSTEQPSSSNMQQKRASLQQKI